MQRVEITRDINDTIEALSRLPIPVEYIGECEECHRRIPAGYVPYVVGWKSRLCGTFKRMVPVKLYCKDCSYVIQAPVHRRRRHYVPDDIEVEEQVLSAKEVASKLWAVMSSEAHGSKMLAKLAELDYDEYGEVIVAVLKKLMDAGKVQFEEGKWRKAT